MTGVKTPSASGSATGKDARRSPLHLGLRAAFVPLVRRLWLKEVEGAEHLPRRGPAIIAANHQSLLDFAVFEAALPRPPIFLVNKRFYARHVLAWCFDRMFFVPVDQEDAGRGGAAIREAAGVLAAGEHLAIFPEGGLSPDGDLQKAYEGIGLLAHLSEAPVIPVALRGTHEAWPKGTVLPRPRPCAVCFGEPLAFTRAQYRADRAIIAQSTRRIMRAVGDLAGKEYRW